jgi:hypothetical protein
MGIVQKLGTKVKKAVKTPTLEDLDAAIATAEAASLERAKASQRSRDAFTVGFDDLANEGDEVGIRRLREEITAAERLQAHAEDNVRLHHGRREKLRAAQATAAHDQVITEFERMAQLMYSRAQAIRDNEEALAASLDEYLRIGLDLQRLVDALLAPCKQRQLAAAGNNAEARAQALRNPGRVLVEEFRPLFSTDGVMQLAGLDMAVFTQGRWPTRNLGIDLYSVTQGPRIDRRAQEYLKLLQRQLIEASAIQPPPPRAA